MFLLPLTQGRLSIIDDVDADLLQYRWHAMRQQKGRTVYAGRAVKVADGTQRELYLHRVIADRMGIAGNPDHRDRNGLNNMRGNLRPDPDGLNQANVGLQASNTSGYKGVSWSALHGLWRVRVASKSGRRHVGLFSDVVAAARAYDAVAIREQGEFAWLNFPPPLEPTPPFVA